MWLKQILLAFAVLAFAPSAFGQLCDNTCGPDSECDTACYTCQFDYPDGTCPPEYTTWKTCGDFGGSVQTYDMVEWMVQTYSGHQSTYLSQSDNTGAISDFSIHDTTNRRFYRMNERNGRYNELFEYDSNYIYSRREVYDATAGRYNAHPNYVWTKRFVTLGSSCGATTYGDSDYTRYQSCAVTGSGGPDIRWVVSAPETLNLGGDVGTVQALRLTQYNLSNPNYVERYYYAKPWGMVFYQKVESGVVTVQNSLNTKFSPEPALVLPCGVPY